VKCRDLPGASLVVLCAVLVHAAYADIYKCTDETGDVAYQQTPCPVEGAGQPSATGDEVTPVVEAVQEEEATEPLPESQSPEEQVASSRQPGERVEDCRKRYRDQIDAIDAEMRTGFSTEQGTDYKESLLALTRQLRACE